MDPVGPLARHRSLRRGVAALLLLAAVAAGQAVRITPVQGDPVVLEDWSVGDGHFRGKRPGAGAFSISMQRAWIVEPRAAPVAGSPDAATAPFLLIRGGTRVHGKLTGGAGGEFRFDLAMGGSGSIAKEFLQGFRIAPARAEEDGDAGFTNALAKPPADQDLVYLIVRDKVRRFAAAIHGVRDGKLALSLRGREAELELATVYGVVFGVSSGIAAQAARDGDYAAVSLHDGRVLRGTLVSAGSEQPVVLRLVEGMQLSVPLNRIREIELGSDKLIYLSGLKPRSRSQAAALDRTWPILRDKGIGGGPLQLGDKTYRRGFFIVPTVRLEFDLPRSFDRLLGEVGLSRASFGSARVRFLVDGKPVGDEITLRADGNAIELSRELPRARDLTLEVLATEDLDVGAGVVLGDLRVIVD